VQIVSRGTMHVDWHAFRLGLNPNILVRDKYAESKVKMFHVELIGWWAV